MRHPAFDQDTGSPAVFITLDGKGARIFSKVSGENVGRLMAVVFIERKTETVELEGETDSQVAQGGRSYQYRAHS